MTSRTKVAVLGAAGMLGSMVVDYLHRDNTFSVLGAVRSTEGARQYRQLYPGVDWQVLDAEHVSVAELLSVLDDTQWIINCIGIIKPHIHDDSAAEIERAIRVNALFPHVLAQAAEASGPHVLQIATDCVYSGNKGKHLERDHHDGLDVYGKTKSLGEVHSSHVHHLRVSIIGPEPRKHVSLLDWFLNQPFGSSVRGFTNHDWNGITTLQFSHLCRGIIQNHLTIPHVQHIVPADVVSKAELLQLCAGAFGRQDIQILPVEAETTVDRTLATENPTMNQALWEAAGYKEIPRISAMISDLGQADVRFGSKYAQLPVASS
jgi:dTDP-4-dehydrorhamnose reductase